MPKALQITKIIKFFEDFTNYITQKLHQLRDKEAKQPKIPTNQIWRRERDSNPRYRHRHFGFQDRRNQPLCHLSRKLPTYSIYKKKMSR